MALENSPSITDLAAARDTFKHAYAQFHDLHSVLSTKLRSQTNSNYPNSPPPSPDHDEQAFLQAQLNAVHQAWRELLFAYDNLASLERQLWDEESACLDLIVYIKSFASWLELDFNLIRGWQLPGRYQTHSSEGGRPDAGRRISDREQQRKQEELELKREMEAMKERRREADAVAAAKKADEQDFEMALREAEG